MTETESPAVMQWDEKRRTEHSFGDVLQTYRLKSRMSQAGLAELLGTTRNTVNNWENERSKPDYETIRRLVQLFHIPLYELFGLVNDAIPNVQENTMLGRYRLLNASGQRVARTMIEALLEEEARTRAQQLRDAYRILPLEATPAAAGTGCLEVEVPPSPCFIRNSARSRRADALIRVSGRSMEPEYQDGDLVYVKFTAAADDGDDVVCYYAGGAVIKRMRGSRLCSLNADYPFGDKSEDDHVRVMGRVLGIVERDELPDEDERAALEDVLAEELGDFQKKYGME